ncbi:lipopolysaccharide ABC transporter ATP-binding protein [Candidatus Termititenax persephonae]|uniref:Lipopolysaccharide ABC transporter ATP-binding protein n=1 Tax=Candidatus Termititenax persephonae TaxID=2218525 RepID=A0A388TIC2_9BACT|nr:lipopolysaccharide ABC transporter ATP-binding protein [Candidatus Termititenax persephonae]
MIETQGLVKAYHKKRVVNEVNIHIKKGEIVGLLGPNGAGKTTTFYMIVGLIRPDAGVVNLNDMEVTHLPMHLRARQGIGYLPQEASIFRKLTVEENLLILWENMPQIPRAEYQERMDKLFAELKISHIRKQRGYELSGGERRRVEICRALACYPDFILLDEPFAGIDPIAVNDIQEIIAYLARTKGLGILITDHNVRETLGITDRAYIIHQGKVLLEGEARSIANDQTARKFYLGENFNL